ncbi:MAG: extracellular solute-binding protein [Lachnospiraceae bacterium]|nr:extracellular solute-binding protein [Lachnospiraceae bacterium]
MRKKLVALLLALTCLVSVLGGCSTGTETKTPTGTSAETDAPTAGTDAVEGTDGAEGNGEIAVDAFAGTTLTIAMSKNAADLSEDFNDKLIFQLAEEATGIHIDWIPVDPEVQEERVNIMLSSDMPDAFIKLLSEEQVGQEAESFYDLSEEGLLETYAPDVLAAYETVEGGLDMVRWSDGSIRSLVTGLATDYNGEPGPMWVINKTWLDQLGLDVPETAEEFYNVLKAFKENDMNGDGDATDEIPATFCNAYWAGNFMNYADAFGIPGYNQYSYSHYFMVQDGKVVPTVDTDNYRAFLEYFYKLGQEGLFDVEGFSQTTEQAKAKIKEGHAGVFMTYTASSYLNDSTFYQPDDYVPMRPFQGLEGVEPMKSGTKDRLAVDRTGFVVSADCENVEALLHWWNYIHSSTELKMIAYNGEQGGNWDITDDGTFVKNPENKLLPEGMTGTQYDYTYAIVNWPPFITKDELLVKLVPDDPNDQTLRVNNVTHVYDMMQDEYLPVRFTDPEKISERSFIEVDLFAYIENFTALSVANGVTDASWEQHLAQLEAYGYYDWIDWYQGFVDGEY